MPHKIKAVIIDLDDTLCLTEEVSFLMENEALAAIARKPMTRKIHQSTWGQPLFEAIKVRSPGVDVEAFKKAFDSIIKVYVVNDRLDAISSENLAALEALGRMDKALLILTSRVHSELEHLLEKSHVLAKHIEAFYYKDNMKFHKPDPRAFEHIEQEHGWKPEECVYVGDSPGDAAAAKGANLHFIASLESGLRTEHDFKDYPVDAFITIFSEVVGAVKKLER